jgi:predicted nucleic acid-binding Zn ribbon protein
MPQSLGRIKEPSLLAGRVASQYGVISPLPKKGAKAMLKLKPRLDLHQHRQKLLRRKRCTICSKPFIGHHSSRQCSDPCRGEAVRARGRVSSQKIRDARREPLPDMPCLWCRKPMQRERNSRQTCSDACRKALSRFDRARKKSKRMETRRSQQKRGVQLQRTRSA